MRRLWRCPACARRFANRNQEHSCGRFTVEALLAGKSLAAVDMYRHFESAVREVGPIIVAPAKTRIGFQARMIFASINRLSGARLDAHVVLARRLENSRFTRIETISPRNHVHHFQIRSLAEIDAEMKSWLKEAYQVGLQEHLKQ